MMPLSWNITAAQQLPTATPRPAQPSPLTGAPSKPFSRGDAAGGTHWVCLADRHLLGKANLRRVGPQLRLLGCADESGFGGLERERWVNHLGTPIPHLGLPKSCQPPSQLPLLVPPGLAVVPAARSHLVGVQDREDDEVFGLPTTERRREGGQVCSTHGLVSAQLARSRTPPGADDAAALT